jgi:hypothetical protein
MAAPGLVLRNEIRHLTQQFVASDTAKHHCQAFFASRLIGGEKKLVGSLDRNQLSTQRREAHGSEYTSQSASVVPKTSIISCRQTIELQQSKTPIDAFRKGLFVERRHSRAKRQENL